MYKMLFVSLLFLSFPALAEEDGGLSSKMIACTMDAKECPDGSFVSRTGDDCSFAPCPGEGDDDDSGSDSDSDDEDGRDESNEDSKADE